MQLKHCFFSQVSYAPVQGVELFPDSDDDLLNVDESSSPELVGAERLLYRRVSTVSILNI